MRSFGIRKEEDAVSQPTIAILLATYEPREDWLIELLCSLNEQSYPALHLYVRDDASPTFSCARLRELLETHITRFPYTLLSNEQNLGSNGTFAALVTDATEPYIAFCDQDDIWLPDKLKNTMELLQSSPLSPTLVCANVSVIDGGGKPIADRMEAHRKRHVFLRGEGLAPTLIYRNFVMGCTVVMERERAVSYLPFPNELVHDHYLAFRAALDGAIDFLAEPQMRYRVYGGNQTGVMTGVRTKRDYLERRIRVFDGRIRALERVADLPALREARRWCDARLANFDREPGSFRALWRLRHVNFVTTLFELLALRFSTPLFRWAIGLIRRGML